VPFDPRGERHKRAARGRIRVVSEPSRAVFLSYASPDAEAARKICDALRKAGIEVWFDQTELRGGDAWDQSIRQQIRDCRLFIPIISARSEQKLEGYFRREWKLAADRTDDMDSAVPFLVPVVIDATPNTSAHVPDKFRQVQWTKLPDGDTSAAFIERLQRLLSPPAASAGESAAKSRESPGVAAALRRPRGLLLGFVALLVIGVAGALVVRLWGSRQVPSAVPAVINVAPEAPAFSPPAHSIAVLPFVNMSGDKEQDYFSEGLSEELLNDLARIKELQVAARTSAFSFRGKDTDIGTIARKLNVGAVLEGSVRRSAQTVRVTAQLINAVTGFHMWSQTYDRDPGDVLKLQTELAESVATALKVTLLGNTVEKLQVGGTNNPAAFDAYLRASKRYISQASEEDALAAISGYGDAVRLDPDYALAYAERSTALYNFAQNYARGATVPDYLRKAHADALKAISLAPNLGEAHMALAFLFESDLNFTDASQEYARALDLAPGKARLVRNYALFAVKMGRTDAGLAAGRRAVTLDPLSSDTHIALGQVLVLARRYDEALAVLNGIKALNPPPGGDELLWTGYAYYQKGDLRNAQLACEKVNPPFGDVCLAATYEKLGRRADARVMLSKLQASSWGTAHPILSAGVYAQRKDTERALQWLDAAVHQHDTYLSYLKVDPMLDSLRHLPRYKLIELGLNFPP
jgi:TolB-like protein/Tfp pilus assembly protein PilF